MLSDILEEQILVKAEQHSPHPNGYSHVAFGSTKSYRVSTELLTLRRAAALSPVTATA